MYERLSIALDMLSQTDTPTTNTPTMQPTSPRERSPTTTTTIKLGVSQSAASVHEKDMGLLAAEIAAKLGIDPSAIKVTVTDHLTLKPHPRVLFFSRRGTISL